MIVELLIMNHEPANETPGNNRNLLLTSPPDPPGRLTRSGNATEDGAGTSVRVFGSDHGPLRHAILPS